MELRLWQKKALAEWKKNKSGVVKVVTGGGKTFFAISCISHLLKSQPDIKVLILVPSITLLDQWVIDLQNNFELKIDKIGGGFNTGLSNQICVSTYGSLSKISDKVKRSNTFLICDECHKAATDRIGSLLRKGWVAKLGLSATPERDFDENFDSILVPILGKIIFNYDYVEAYKDKVIADFELINVYAPMMSDEDEDYENLTKKIGKRIAILGGMNPSDNALKILLFQRARIINNAINRIPAAQKIIESYKRKKWIIFSETIEQAERFFSILKRNNYKAAIYHSKISPIKRQYNLFLLKNDLIDILVTCKSLDEGFDYPDLDSAIIISSSTTSRQRIQRLGRVLRSSSNKDKALIVSIYSSDDEYERLRNEQLDFQEHGINIQWTKLKF